MSPAGVTLCAACAPDLGLVRGNNEDSVYAGPRLLAIADGMGGHAAGEVASKIVIGTLEPLDEDRRIDDLIAALRDAVAEAQRAASPTRSSSARNSRAWAPPSPRCGSPARQVGLVHVGDSRAYLLRGGPLCQITHDDTYVQYLVDSGKLTPEEAKDHPRKSVILRALHRRGGRAGRLDPRGAGRRPLPALLRRAVRRRARPRRSPRRCTSTTRRSAPTGWSSWRCAAAARTTSRSSSPTWSTRGSAT